MQKLYFDCIPGTFWIDRLDVLVEIVPDEEMTEHNPRSSGIARTGGEGTEKPSFRVGERIAIATARLDDEVRGNFHTQIPVKFKRFGYIYGVHWGHMVDPRTPNWGSISITPGKLRATGGIGHS